MILWYYDILELSYYMRYIMTEHERSHSRCTSKKKKFAYNTRKKNRTWWPCARLFNRNNAFVCSFFKTYLAVFLYNNIQTVTRERRNYDNYGRNVSIFRKMKKKNDKIIIFFLFSSMLLLSFNYNDGLCQIEKFTKLYTLDWNGFRTKCVMVFYTSHQ